jgi:hypothetical protein
MVEGQPNEGAHLQRARVVPHSHNDLRNGGVPEVEPLDEGMNTGSVVGSLGIPVSPFC